MTDIQSQLEPLTADDFRQDQTRVCTIIAYLIGVDWQKCSFYYELPVSHQNKFNAELLRNPKSNGI